MDVWSLLVPGQLTRAWSRRSDKGIAVFGGFQQGGVDVVDVPEFDVEVGFPAAVESGVREAAGLELVGECNASAVKRESVMRNSYAVNAHDGDEKNGNGRKLRMDALLVEPDEAGKCGHQQAKSIAVIDQGARARSQKEKQAVCTGEGSEQKP
jgi:hypothetical protein